MKLTIKAINRKPITTKYGDTNKVGIQTLEYPDTWLNGFEDEINKDWKKGDIIEATITEDQYGLKFKAMSAPPQPFGSQVARQGMVKDREEADQDKWNKISFGKCKHAYLLEAYKMGKNLEAVETEAERWAEASMRKLEEPEFDIPEETF